MPSVKGCWKCHALIRRGKLCSDCVTMAFFGGLTVVATEILVWLVRRSLG